MRPITLTMAGLRSYRSERTIHFGDPGLIAIIGDTGAGKSSILEAITGALYGACTWDNRGIGELISDGVQTVQLELTFAVAGHIWTISRSASRNNYPPSRHVLHCHDTGEKLTGERAVTARITELLGLDTKQFLRVVVLPQNRFMELLNARRSDRNTILKGIFRLEDLDRVRQAADRLRDDLEPKLTQVRLARGKLADNPAARLADARARRAAAEQDRARIQDIRDIVTTRRATIAALATTADTLQGAISQTTAERSRAAGVDRTLADAALAAAELDAQAGTLADRRRDLQAREQAAQQALDAATANGQDTGTLAAAVQALDSLTNSVPALITGRGSLVSRAHELARQASEITALREQLQASETELDERTTALSAVQEQATVAQIAHDKARATLAELDQALASAAHAASQSDQSRRSVSSLRQTARQAATASELADSDALDAEAQLQETQRRNSAAHAAEGCQPGNPCPVCDRPLPETFTPPAAADEAAVSGHARRLRALAVDADRNASRAAEQARRAADDLADAIELEVTALGALARAAAAVSDAAPGIPAAAALALADPAAAVAALAAEPVTREPDAIRGAASDLAHNLALDQASNVPAARGAALSLVSAVRAVTAPGIDELIGPLVQHAAELLRQQQRAQADRDQLSTLIAGLRMQAKERADAAEREQEQLLARRDELVAEANQVAGQLAALPAIAAGVRRAASLTPVPVAELTPGTDYGKAPAQPELSAPASVSLPASNISEFAAAIQLTDTRLRQELRSLEAHQRDLREARKELGDLSLSEQQLATDRTATVSRPLRQTGAMLQSIQTRAADLRLALSQAAQHADGGPAAESLPELAHTLDSEEVMSADQVRAYRSATAAFLAAADKLAEGAEQVLASVNQRAAVQEQAIADTLAQHQLADLAALQQAEIDCATRLQIADRDARQFQSEMPVAAALDKGIAEAASVTAVLRAVGRALTSTQFVDYVIARRSTALLLVASRLLGQLTGDGYGFTDDFQIIDRRTRTERDVKTLSGGETFLASLALALGLVELAGRSGGRIDSLFLDEGFGSLDTTNLAEALDVLRGHVSTGRMVTVISHLHAVATDLDRVLLVTKKPTGSDLRWLQPAEREQLLLDDVSAGLLA